MPNIAGRDGQSVFPGDGGNLRVPQIAVLPPVLSLGCFQLGGVAAPLRRGSSIKIHKASSVVLTEELEFRASVSSEWRLVRSAIFGRLTFAITAAMGNFFEPVARLV